MCGIAGLINYGKPNREEIMQKMIDRMIYRGPDACGIWADNKRDVVLGHRRLSIRDLSINGAQPMISANERYVIAYNGEIYNADEIAQKLIDEKKVTSFRGSCDTEVLLEAIAAYGMAKALKLSKGMFAIAVYDRDTGVLKLARDRVGEKPLYYGFVNGSFTFASDIGCFTQIENFDNEINQEVLDIYFIHGYIPAPYSIYKDIYKLEAGTILTINPPYQYEKPLTEGMQKDGKAGNISFETYWSMKEAAIKGQNNLFKGSRQEASLELERLLKASVKSQMVADVPLGAFLSAGIDSSTIVSLMQDVAPGKVKSFTIGMEDPKYNEADIAAKIAAHLGTTHTEMYITDADAKSVIPKLPQMFGEPFADSSQIPTYLVSKMTRDHVTVSLSGDGGDELFCGYTSYASIRRIWSKMGRIPYGIRKPISSMAGVMPFIRNNKAMNVRTSLLAAKNTAQLHMIESDYDPEFHKIALMDGNISYKHTQLKDGVLSEPSHDPMLMDMLMYHPDDILVKVDRTAMAVSLESRVPMLDRDVVEFAWSLPIDYLVEGDVGKQVLRDVLYRHVPKELFDRPKKGFSIPIDKWLREGELKGWAEGLLDEASIKQMGYLDSNVVSAMWRDFVSTGEWKPQIWYILMFQQWIKNR
ncbi:MAG: asparagine synthase (glutamine-hydrolyzing) [Butyrivibrio sp.]|nr:asparagine synthase (glutamine-hydrolyzing) [Butyrivibrio sp.]